MKKWVFLTYPCRYPEACVTCASSQGLAGLLCSMRERRLHQSNADISRRSLDTIGTGLSAARRVRKVTPENLAERINVSCKVVSRMEMGDPTISFGVYLAAAWATGLDKGLADIFAQEEEPVFEGKAKVALAQQVRLQKPGIDEMDF